MNKRSYRMFGRYFCAKNARRAAHRALQSTNSAFRLIKNAVSAYRRAAFVKRNRSKIASFLVTMISASFTEALNFNIAAIVLTVVLGALLAVTWK